MFSQLKIMLRDLNETDELSAMYGTVLFQNQLQSLLGYSISPEKLIEMPMDHQRQVAEQLLIGKVFRVKYRINSKGYVSIKTIEAIARLGDSTDNDNSGDGISDTAVDTLARDFGSQNTADHVDSDDDA